MTDGPTLTLAPPAADLDLEAVASEPAEPLTRDEMLEAIPLHITVWDEVNLDAADPAETDTRRQCVAVRRAGGRCTATAPANSLLCNAHSGVLDPRAGGLARAQQQREASESQEERERVGRLGTRALIADTLAAQGLKVKRTVEVLLDAASQGDLAAAKAVIPYLNQGLGMPTEHVALSAPETSEDLAAMGTADLAAYVAARRQRRQQAS